MREIAKNINHHSGMTLVATDSLSFLFCGRDASFFEKMSVPRRRHRRGSDLREVHIRLPY